MFLRRIAIAPPARVTRNEEPRSVMMAAKRSGGHDSPPPKCTKRYRLYVFLVLRVAFAHLRQDTIDGSQVVATGSGR